MTDISRAAVDALLLGVTRYPINDDADNGHYLHEIDVLAALSRALSDDLSEQVWDVVRRLSHGAIQVGIDLDNGDMKNAANIIVALLNAKAALRAALDDAEARAVKAEAERDAANALLRRITRNVDADGVGTVLIIDLQAARAHLGAKP